MEKPTVAYYAQPTKKTGKILTIEDLIEYFKKNKENIETVGTVDLNEVPKIEEKISKLHFQDVQKVSFLPEKLSEIFKLKSHKYLHAGILQFINNDNISFYSSIITCLKQHFSFQPIETQKIFMSSFLRRLSKESKNAFFNKMNYKSHGWTKSDITDTIFQGPINKKVQKFICDYLHVNIFVLDLENDSINFCDNIYVPYKKSIFLLKYVDNVYEPFFSEQSKVFKMTDFIMKCVKENQEEINVNDIFNSNSKFEEVLEDLQQYIPPKPKLSKKEIEEKEKLKKEDKKKPIEQSYDENTNAYDENSDESNNSGKVQRVKTKGLTEKSEDESSSESSSESNKNKVNKTSSTEEQIISESVAKIKTLKKTRTKSISKSKELSSGSSEDTKNSPKKLKTIKNIEGFKISKLKEIATEYNIKIAPSKKKNEIIEILRKFNGEKFKLV